MFEDLEESWKRALCNELAKPYLRDLELFLENERSQYTIYPPQEKIFSAFAASTFEKTKVVILGQDPYHGPGQAHGLAFSVKKGVPFPPSLKNIFIELKKDLGIPLPSHGFLGSWAEQGVLLLNSILSVRSGEPASHANHGWERFTDSVLKVLCQREESPIIVLWGRVAEKKLEHLLLSGVKPGLILKAAHPSPFSVQKGFFGCKHFSKINEELKSRGREEINWALL